MKTLQTIANFPHEGLVTEIRESHRDICGITTPMLINARTIGAWVFSATGRRELLHVVESISARVSVTCVRRMPRYHFQ